MSLTAEATAQAVAALVRALSTAPDQRDNLVPALLVLSELQQTLMGDPRLEQLLKLERELADRDRGERARAICQRMQLKRTTYYRLRLQVIPSPTQSHETLFPLGLRKDQIAP